MKQNENGTSLPDGTGLVVSSSPHISCRSDVRRIMLLVTMALLPACAAGIYLFGAHAALVLVISVASCVGAEALWCVLRKRPAWATVSDGSALLSGALLAMNLPPSAPWYVPVIGAILAMWLGKQVFGGLGRNPFNPVLVARVGLLIALPAVMTTWSSPRELPESLYGIDASVTTSATPHATGVVVTGATPLGAATAARKATPAPGAGRFDEIDNPQMLWRYFWGARGGCMGETCVPALLLGAVLLIAFNLINYRVPLYYIGTVALLTGIIHCIDPGLTPSPLFHLLTGGLLLGAFFMATDMVTSPITGLGCVVFATGCGVLTTVIRVWGNYPEGVSFSILLMNAMVPLIDRVCAVRPFGYTKVRK
ncbi:MAG: RnfABCDGE type electron transport complex subunit D [Victivallaceae bacterium]|nr:RnfABCDGE type electron transport complex subunit D [Victivallaceae bacterium]